LKTRIHAWGSSDVGMKRDHNEDSYLMAPDMGLYVVADGMGGHAGGELASSLSVTTIDKHVRNQRSLLERGTTHPEPMERSPVAKLLSDAVHAACNAVFARAQRDPQLRGMGTTTTAMLFHDQHAFIAHVGDSRAYLIRDGRITQLSEDHSLVNEQVKAGLITEAQARTSRFKNIITRSIGFDADIEVDVIAVEVKAGDAYLLCSDGCSNLVADDEICSIVHEQFLHQVPGALIELGNSRGGDDNSTIVIGYVVDDAESRWDEEGPSVIGGAASEQ